MHGAHRPGRADDVDSVAGAELGAFRYRGERRGGVGAGGSDDANAAVVDAPDGRVDGAAEFSAALDDDHEPAGIQSRRQHFDHLRIGAEIDDVVEAAARDLSKGIAVGVNYRGGTPGTPFNVGASTSASWTTSTAPPFLSSRRWRSP